MKTRIVRIGNSQGVRIPKPMLDEAGLPDEVDMRAEGGRIVISPATAPRAGWAEAAAAAAAEDAGLLDGSVPTKFDVEEWVW